MKILYSWLREFLPLELSAADTATQLAKLGFEVTSVQSFGQGIEGVVVGEVKNVQKHPNADRLSVCTVSDGENDFSVVCGASNVKAGIRIPFAKLGASLPNGMKIGPAKLRGVESQGMICSAAELGLEEKSEGILPLDDHAQLGLPIQKILDIEDSLIELEITPNRRDTLSVMGISRELAASLSIPLKQPEPRPRELDLSSAVTVTNECPDICPRYIARYAKDIEVKPSPLWMSIRLKRCGIRSINSVVDVTNYVMLELGQPLHAFDVAKLKGRKLIVRYAHKAEEMVLLDGQKKELADQMIVIADQEQPIALAGIMGGENSGIGPETKEIMIESASFDAQRIRSTRKALNISTDSSYRFERGTDWAMVAFASARAAQLIQELAGGIGYKATETAPRPLAPTTIKLRVQKVRSLLGIEMKESVMAEILRRLGCTITTGSEQHLVTVPSWRLDLSSEADLAEEIARLHGYDQIPTVLPAIRQTTVPESPNWAFAQRCTSILIGLGLCEVYTYSFSNEKELHAFIPGLGLPKDTQPIALTNPMSNEWSHMRTSLIPGLLKCAISNFHRSNSEIAFFEFGHIFGNSQGKPLEKRRLAFLLGGTFIPPHWRGKTRTVDFYDMSGIIDTFLGSLGIHSIQKTVEEHAPFHPKRSVTLWNKNQAIGWFGEIHPRLIENLDSKEPLIAAEFDLEALMPLEILFSKYKPLSAFPSVRRDISFVLPESISFENVKKTVFHAAGPVLESCDLIDLYKGTTIGEGQRSLTLTLVLRRADQTLTDTEIEKTMTQVIQRLTQDCKAVLRS